MNYNCPHCEQSIKQNSDRYWKRIGFRWDRHCAKCDGALSVNRSPYDAVLKFLGLLPMIPAGKLIATNHPPVWGWPVVGVIAALSALAAYHLYHTKLKDWPRYTKGEARTQSQ